MTFSNGVNTCKIDFHVKNTITNLNYDLPLNQVFMEKLILTNRFSPADTADLAVSFT